MNARVSQQLALDDWALVGAGVVEHEMQVKLHWRSTLDSLEEVTELQTAVTSVDFGDDSASLDVQGGKEVGRAVSQVVVRMALWLARLYGYGRCGVAVCLDGRLLVYA